MKKSILSVMAIVAFVSLSCGETPQEVTPATISASDITVAEGKTAQISAVSNSSATITYTIADASVATVSETGEVTGIKAGSTTATIKQDAVANLFSAAETTINVTVTADVPVDDGKPVPGVYTFTVSPLKGQWEVGDKILVQGGYGPAAQVITLTASQISSDGKTASAELGGDLFKYLTEPDPLYAVWPADAAKQEDGVTGQVINYAVSNVMLTQAYLVDNNFSFIDISSFLSFTVSGNYDRFIIAGTQRPGLRYKSYKNEYSTNKKTPAKPKDDGWPFREEQLGSDGSLTTLWFPGGISFNGGFTLYFAKGDEWTATYTYTEDAILKPGKFLELGDITSLLQPYSGGKPHMPEVTNYTSYSVKVNELSGLCIDSNGEFLWCVGDGSEIAKISVTGEVIGKTGIYTYDAGSEKAYTVDSEGMSFNYDTGDIIISGEPNVVCGIPADDLDEIFSWSFYAKYVGNKAVNGTVNGYNGVTSLFKIADAANFGNSGAEGCTYYKDGLVYIGTQSGSYLYLCNLETGEVIWRKSLKEKFPAFKEIAGLCYDPITDWLWVTDSEAHKFFALSGDAEQLFGSYTMKTMSNEESICVDHKNNCVWIGDDYGSTSYIYKYEMSGLDDFIITE
jgi:hypothetical protein